MEDDHLSDHTAHLYAGDPDAHRSDDLQMVEDEFLQFADAASLEEKQSVLCCIGGCGSASPALCQCAHVK